MCRLYGGGGVCPALWALAATRSNASASLRKSGECFLARSQ